MQPYYYRSSQSASHAKNNPEKQAKTPRHRSKKPLVLFVLIVLVGAALGINHSMGSSKADTVAAKSTAAVKTVTTPKTTQPSAAASKTTATVAAASSECASNTLSQLVVVSISQRHLWACDGTQSIYDSPVVTGISYLAADLTPVGTYHVYAKYTNTVLKGCDTTGCWNDPVSYWMPFLDNQYGAYGFHDATWRSPSDFGNISPDSANASHGCVECPLATAKWLYSWVQVGTTVSVQA